MVTKVLTSDILIADIIVKISDLPAETREYLQKNYGLTPNSKQPLTKEQFEDISAQLAGAKLQIMPGGSSANTVSTLNRLLGDKEVESTFVGVAGSGIYSQIIKNDLSKARVKLLPENHPEGAPPAETAVSFCFVDDEGRRALYTYPGNAKDILKPDMVSKDLVAQHDAVLVQGSIWQKFDPSFANSIMDERWKQNKELWLCLPTHAKFGAENADLFQYAVPSANLLLSNDDELARTFKTMMHDQEVQWDKEIKEGTPSEKRAAEAFKETARLEARERLLEIFQKNGVLSKKEGMSQKQVAFITRGMKGLSIITNEGIKDIPNPPFIEKDKVNNLGSGDTTFAGIIAGHMKGLSNEQSAKLGMWLAREKLLVDAARIPDPSAMLLDRLKMTADCSDKYLTSLAGKDNYAEKLANIEFAREMIAALYPGQQIPSPGNAALKLLEKTSERTSQAGRF